jgi:hypothetical protein
MMRWFLAIALLLATAARPALAGCDLGQVVGYQLVFAKVIQAYVEDGKRVQGYAGCNRDRVLVFTDGTGVRCKDVGTANANLPTAYLFAKTQNDMKLCVGDDLFDVARPN